MASDASRSAGRPVMARCAACVFAMSAGVSATADLWYVDIDSPVADGDGASWAQACRDLPAALDAAEAANDTAPEFWIAEGLYEVPAGLHIDLTVRPFDQVAIRGGFAGSETSPEQRPPPGAVPPDDIETGTRFQANFSNNTQFIRTNIPTLVERVTASGFQSNASGVVVQASNAAVEIREVFAFGVRGALFGGAVSATSCPAVLIEDSRFTHSTGGSSAGTIGGAVYAAGGTALTIRRSVFEDCAASYGAQTDGDGGALYIGGGVSTLTVEESTFLNCTAGGKGGAVYLSATATATIRTSRFIANDSFQAGAIAVEGNGADTAPLITIADCEFVHHEGARTLSVRRSNLLLTGGAFTANSANSAFAGVVYLLDSNATIEDTAFTSNSNVAADGNGGAVYIHSDGFGADVATVVRRATFTNNRASASGGAIYAEDLNVAVEDSVFDGNNAGEMGGAVYVSADIDPGGDEVPPLIVTGSSFHANAAGIAGGAVATDRELIVERSTFRRNSSDYGGALYQSDSAGFAIENSVFAENAAAVDGAAVAASFLVHSSSIAFSTFYENRAAHMDGKTLAVFVGPAALVLTDTIFSESVTPVGVFAAAGNVTAENILVAPPTALDLPNQIEGTPLFLDPTRGDFRLVSGANVEGLAIGAAAVDIRGAARPQGTGPDLGAYEFTPNEDRDGDRVPDILEGNGDADGDTIPDYLDGDTHNFAFQDINTDGAVNAVDIQLVINAVLGI